MLKRQLAIFSFFLLLFCITIPAYADTIYSVVSVLDGDTIILDDGSRVRIAYVDTPELEHKKRKQQYFSIKAKNFITKEVLGKKVELQRIVDVDRYSRRVAIVTSQYGHDLGTYLVQNGMAFVYPHGRKQLSYVNKLITVQQKAIDNKVGMWNNAITYLNKIGTVVGNRRSKRFFTLNCKFANQISKKNKIYFKSPVDAFYNGYAPARVCKLWPNEAEISVE